MLKAVFFRVRRSGTLFLLALLIAVSLPLAGRLGPERTRSGAAYYLAPGALSEADRADLAQALEELGFAPVSDETSLREGLRRGDWGCGLLLRPEGEALLLQGENAANASLWQGAAGAALFSIRAPALTAQALEPAGISPELARQRYRSMMNGGPSFRLRLVRVDGAPVEDDLPRDRVLLAGAAACLLGAVFAGALPVYEDALLLRRRIAQPETRRQSLALQLGLRLLLLSLATVLGAVFAGQPALAPRLVAYLLLCALLALSALLLTRSPGAVSVAAALLCLLLPVLCPVYLDLGLAVPRLAPVQKLFLPYWLFYRL